MNWRKGLMLWAIASTLLVFFAFASKIPWPLAIGGSWFFGQVVLGICLFQIQRQRKLARFESLREMRRQMRSRELPQQSAATDFEIRLRSFTQSESGPQHEEVFRSNMEFYQKEDQHSKTPARPQSLFRYLLKRISRLVRNRS